MVKKVIIMRGVSGSGKSTYARNFSNAAILSSDDYWTRDGGDYKENFNVEKLGAAHAWNLRRYIDCLVFESKTRSDENDITIVIDNTNTIVAELAPYYAVAQAFQVPVEIITLMVDPKIALARNVHGVPLNAHSAQYSRLVDNEKQIPRWWKHTIIRSS
jgi:predicted kinase